MVASPRPCPVCGAPLRGRQHRVGVLVYRYVLRRQSLAGLNRGALLEEDRRRLLKFLFAVKVKQILVGGGYVGRCLEDLYKEVEQYYSADKIYVVPEITALSPVDVTSSLAADLLLDNGQIDIARLTSGIRANVFGNQAVTPNVRNLSAPGK